MSKQSVPPAHVFISQAHLSSYGGSEMVTLELAEHFAAAGSKVTIGTWNVGRPIISHLADNSGISYFDIDDPRLGQALHEDPPQLAWIHHQIIPEGLLEPSEETAFVFNHMSAVHPLESSWSAAVEAKLASLHLYNSQETLDSHASDGMTSIFDPARMRVFPNPAPDAFGAVARPGREPTRLIGVVSNHLPEELVEVLENPPPGVRFLTVGNGDIANSVPMRVTPQTLAVLDGVVTIGKTVQYALLAGTPVYCYDKFGGPGWLDSENFSVAEMNNFSGRGFLDKPAAVIAKELSEGLDEAQQFAAQIKSKDVSRFTLSAALDEVLEALAAEPRSARILGSFEVRSHSRQQKLVGHYVRNWLRASQK